MNLPNKYLESMKEILGQDFDAYLKSFEDTRLYGLRVNNLKISTEDFLKISPFKLTPIPWIENGFYYEEDEKPAKHPYYYAGLYYIQEPSAMTPANVLPINEGDVVLDMCAAPGGKSTELAAKLNNTGLLVTNDISNSRTKALLKNVEINGCNKICVLNEDPKLIADRFSEFFDKILIDAPCSGEGMFRKDNKLIKAWEKTGPEVFSEIQKSVIMSGAKMLKPGGMMLYSTCTFSKLEDEETIMHLLNNRDDFELVDIKPYEGFSHGFEISSEAKDKNINKTVRIFPHKMKGEGHYVALLRKKGDNEINNIRYISQGFNSKVPTEVTDFLDSFNFEYDKKYINIRGTYVYLVSKYMQEEKGLRIIRNGLLLGEIKKNRFEPSQALAMALKLSDYPNVINLDVKDERVVKYLKGETLDCDDFTDVKDGWVLIGVSGYPLGWGKFKNGQVKNKYLAGWRWM
ncbi:RsmF rRNA methyltransferase first C-terminal domain-containing protein [Lachnospira multipara]|uniref:RsmF rRNA methyltransferase first C-terminal domain-containing protein n=1 Tax=Lachnospira multipara TaxID=28051 RepID=UPI0004818137|nr:RsmB/NOP family class I SAM-dependent RNA methyltransferase [Lachnospira multipara]